MQTWLVYTCEFYLLLCLEMSLFLICAEAQHICMFSVLVDVKEEEKTPEEKMDTKG